MWPLLKVMGRFLTNRARILLSLLMLVLALQARADVSIHGKVTDADRKPIEFATVRVAGTAVGVQTASDGAYRLRTADADTIVVVFSCVGYDTERRTLIRPSGDLALSISLKRSPKQLQEVEIREIKKQTGSMTALDVSSYRLAADATGGSVESMLATLPGVSGRNELSTQYSVRGGSFDENGVYVNGLELYRPQLVSSGEQEGLSVINPEMTGAIGFSTGGFAAEYADRMSSVLDITYRRPERLEASLTASFMGGSLTFGQASDRFSQLHGVRYRRNSSLLGSMDTKGEYDPSFFDYQTNLIWNLSKRVRVSAIGNIALNHYRFEPADRTTSFGTSTDAKRFKVYFDGRERDRFETWTGALTLDWMASDATLLTLRASGFLSDELVTYDISGEYWLDEAGSGSGDDAIGGELGVGRYHEHARGRLKSEVAGAMLKGVTAHGANQLAYGLELSRRRFMEDTREWEMRDSAGFSLPADPGALRVFRSLSSRHDMAYTVASAWVQDTYRVSTAAGFFNLNGGLRVTRSGFNRETLVSPRLSAGFVPAANPRWALRFAAGVYSQGLFFKEYRQQCADSEGNIVTRLNPDLKSPRSIHFILGSDYTFRALGRPFKVSGEAYVKALSRLIPYELQNLKVVYAGENLSDGYAAGIDFKLFGQFVPGSDSWLSFSLMKTRENLNGKAVPLPNDRRYSIALYFTDYFPRIPRLKFSLRGLLTDGLPVTAPYSSRDKGYFRTPPYKRIDAGLSYGIVTERDPSRLVKSAWIGLDVFNLLDLSNVSSYYWVTDINNLHYAVPNYLTRRQLTLTLTLTI